MYGEFEAGLVRQLAEVTAERDALQERLVTLQRILSGVKGQRDALRAILDHARTLAKQQTEDDGLWFHAETASEGYLQHALRQLARAVEGDPRAQEQQT